MIQLVHRPTQADVVLAVDASWLAYRSLSVHPDLATSDGRRSGHVFGALQGLLGAIRGPCRRFYSRGDELRACVAVCVDGPLAVEARRALVPEYKVGRDHEFDPKPDVVEALSLVCGVVAYADDREADDGIAKVAGHCERARRPCVILTGDGDAWQLIGQHARVWISRLQRFVAPEDLAARFCTDRPSAVALAKALMGDGTDKIKGIPRVPHAQCAKALAAGADTPAQFYDVHFDAMQFTPMMRQRVLDARPDVEAKFRVASPWTEGIGVTPTVPGSKREELRALLERWECREIAKDLALLAGG